MKFVTSFKSSKIRVVSCFALQEFTFNEYKMEQLSY